MNKKISLGVAFALMFIVATVTFTTTVMYTRNKFNQTVSNITQREAMYDKLAEIDTYVRNNYIGSIDEDLLMDSIAYGYMSGIEDRYGSYYTVEQYEQITNSTEGKIVGIGITASRTENGYILVEEVYPDSPAAAAQIVAGELIVKVNDIDLTPETYADAINEIGGQAGTTLSLVVRNGSEDREITEITRRKVQKPTVYSNSFDEIGYVRIMEFNGTTYDQFKTAVETLLNGGATSLVFDVRDNGGGTLDAVVKVLDMLLPEGDLATSVDKSGNVEVIGTSDESHIDVPMVVLTNGNTASAAELFTQALRDYEAAKSVGTKTYGKGTMQVYHKLKDGSAIKITTNKYNPPLSQNYDGIGITPDYEVAIAMEEILSADAISPEMDPQLAAAVEYLTTGTVTASNEINAEDTTVETETDIVNGEETTESEGEESSNEESEEGSEEGSEESTEENTEE